MDDARSLGGGGLTSGGGGLTSGGGSFSSTEISIGSSARNRVGSIVTTPSASRPCKSDRDRSAGAGGARAAAARLSTGPEDLLRGPTRLLPAAGSRSVLIANLWTPERLTRSMTWMTSRGARLVGRDDRLQLRVLGQLDADVAHDRLVAAGLAVEVQPPSLASVSASVVLVCSVPDAALGRSTLIAGLTISDAVTMKMISNTSVMSTSGVTLMSTIIRPESSSLP
jgi:hypothetical protein